MSLGLKWWYCCKSTVYLNLYVCVILTCSNTAAAGKKHNIGLNEFIFFSVAYKRTNNYKLCNLTSQQQQTTTQLVWNVEQKQNVCCAIKGWGNKIKIAIRPAFMHRATWEQWIHVLQTQNCLAAVIQNLQQKRENYPGRAVGRAAVGELWVNSSCSSEVQGRKKDFTIATLRYHGNTSVSQYGA